MLADFLGSRATIVVQRKTQDEAGGIVRAPFQLLQESVPCLVREGSGRTDRAHNQATQLGAARIYFDPAALSEPLTSRHQIHVLQSNAPARVFTVEDASDANSLGRLLAVDCLERK